MKEILIINLTRMGDLLQTTPLMAGLKVKHPGSRITLLANTTFTEICKGIPFIDDLIVFDMKGYRNRLLEKQYTLVENYRFLEALISQINRKEYDLTINVTHSPISAILTSFVRTKEIRGFTIDSEGHRIIKHPWMRYFFNVIPTRIYNPFHLVDMYLKIGDVMPEVKGLVFRALEEEEEKAELLLRTEGVSEDDMLIGIHLGASKSDKTWPVSSYAELADLIASSFGAKIVLFGTAGEKDLADEFEMTAGVKPVNFVGKTDLGELSALLKRCKLFISNDTGPLHIATSVGTTVIDISTANVHFMETGPYGEGHYVIQADLPCVPCGFDVECKDMVCKSFIKPHAVFEVVKDVVKGQHEDYKSDSPTWKDIQVFKSCFKEDGLLGFYPLIRHPLSKEIIYRLLYRQVWNKDFNPADDKAGMGYENICAAISSCYSFNGVHEIIPSIKRELDVVEKLVNLAGEGSNLVNLIAEEAEEVDRDIKKIKEIWRKIEVIDNEIELIGHTNSCFQSFVIIFKFAKEALEGDELRTLAVASSGIYNDLMNSSSRMLQLMKRLIFFLESNSEGNKCILTSDIVQNTLI
jgi:ADP-heptose:LPS heptosyltransferase